MLVTDNRSTVSGLEHLVKGLQSRDTDNKPPAPHGYIMC